MPVNNRDPRHPIFTPVRLPCGVEVPNTLVKVAMYEHSASILGGPPNDAHLALYSAWSKGGWGMVITGNVQVSPTHLTLGRDLVLPECITPRSVQPFAQLARVIHGTNTGPGTDVVPSAVQHDRVLDGRPLAIMQLSHAGRQSPLILGGRPPFSAPIGPSAVPLGRGLHEGLLSRLLYSFLFQTPREMTEHDIDRVVDGFTRGARLAHASGFDGVELHASHGYLLAQFFSPKSNKRLDAYSSEDRNALRIVHRIVREIRAVVQSRFVVGIKLNAADYSSDDTSEARALGHLREIASWGMVDFIEVSGGDYEDPEFMTTAMATTSPRQAFFSRFSRQAVKTLACPSTTSTNKHPPPVILLTGGLRTYDIFCDVLTQGHAQLIGIGRTSVLCPELPRLLAESIARHRAWDDRPDGPFPTFLREPLREPDLRLPGPINIALKYVPLPKLIGAGVGMAWYTVQMRRIAKGQSIDYALGGLGAIVEMWVPQWTFGRTLTMGWFSIIILVVVLGALL